MEELQSKRKELDERVKRLKEFMTNSVKEEFSLQKEIESLKLQNSEYEEQNKLKETENEKLKSDMEILQEKLNLLSEKKEKIEIEKKDLQEKVDLERKQIEEMLEGHQEVLEKIVDLELGLKKGQKEKHAPQQQVEKEQEAKSKLESELVELCRENEEWRQEVESLLDVQGEVAKKMEKWRRQKGKVGKIVKECRGIVSKSRKLMKRLRKVIPQEKKFDLKMSQTMDNFFEGHSEQQKRKRVSGGSASEENLKKVLLANRSNLRGQTDDSEGEDFGEKMYHTTNPEQERREGDFPEKKSQKLASMSIGRFKKNRSRLKNSKYFREEYSDSGKGKEKKSRKGLRKRKSIWRRKSCR